MTTHHGASSSSSSSQAPPYTYEYDVFLSFRGTDTRDNFTAHLYNALDKKGFKTFIDDSLEKGEEISSSLLQTIERSKIAVIVFSKNFASSSWCLDELVKILECKELGKHIVKPVFYQVNPSDIRHQTTTFGEALTKHEERFRKDEEKGGCCDSLSPKTNLQSRFYRNMDKLAQWRSALRKAANLSGWHYSDGSESDFINNIVEDITKQIQYTNFNVADHPVGIESRFRDMERYLGDGEIMIGIWGVGGIGKSTIARAVYNSIAKTFDGSCFLNVGEAGDDDLVGLQTTLLDKIQPGRQLPRITDVYEGMDMIKSRLSTKKVLIVLDDVNQLDQLKKLVESSNSFDSGSRIIITTRDRRLLHDHDVKLIYNLKELSGHEAKQLFYAHAFRGECPQEYEELADKVVEYTQGLPLALEQIGKFLKGRPIEEWEEELTSNRKSPQRSLYERLRKSYDDLSEDCAKELFLDIACFFRGESKNHVKHILQCAADRNRKPEISFQMLADKALIHFDVNNHILMHNVLEVMGKAITLVPPIEPIERRRLCFYDDVYDVLTEGRGTDKIEGIMVMSPGQIYDEFPPVLEQDSPEIELNARSFSGMRKLKYFKNRDAPCSGEMESLPNNLRLIDWPHFPFEALPLDFDPKKLVKLNMPGSSCMLQLGGTFKSQSCRYLKYINLESCSRLQAIPSLSEFPKLQELNLNNCTSLTGVDDSAGHHKNLVVLSLAECHNLTALPRTIAWKNAREINLCGCSKLETFPSILEEMESLTCLDLSRTAITELPASIRNLTGLTDLKLRDCENLLELPHSMYGLHNLEKLDLRNCSKLVTFPRWNAESHQTNLRHLNLRGCKKLREIPDLPPKVEWVNADGCESLERFAILSNILRRRESSQIMASISLYRCQRLCDNIRHDVAGNEGTLCSLIHSSKQPEFHLVFPGSEVPRWFSCRNNLTELVDKSEFSFNVPLDIRMGYKGLAICAAATAVDDSGECSIEANVCINEHRMPTISFCFEAKEMGRSGHVWMWYIPFVKLGHRPPFTCRVSLEHTSQTSVRCTSYGVHLVMRVPSAL